MAESMNSTFNGTFNGTSSDHSSPVPKNFWTGLLLPIAYIVILIGSLYSFSSVYRQRQVSRAAKLEPWFGPHVQKNIYLSLLHLDPAEDATAEKKLAKIPDSILKTALLKRAVEDIQRVMALRQAKPALQTLLQRGSVGDELWQRFQIAEQEIEAEIKDVVNEANAFSPGWGQVIFQSANEMYNNLLAKQRITELREGLAEEKSWWENRRQGIRSDFMKELESNGAVVTDTSKKPTSDDDAVLVDANIPAGTQGTGSVRKKKAKK